METKIDLIESAGMRGSTMLASQSIPYIVARCLFCLKMWDCLVFLGAKPYTPEDLHFLQGGAYKLQEFLPNPGDIRRSLLAPHWA